MIPPKPSKPNGEKPKKRQGRIHWQTPVKLYPMELIQYGWPILALCDQLDYLMPSDVAKIFLWQVMTQETANRKVPPHPRSLRQAQNAANELNLRRLKDLGHLHVEAVPKKIINRSRITYQRRELHLLSRPGRDALKRHLGVDPSWSPDLYRRVHNQTEHDWQVHAVVVNLLTAFRLAGGEFVDVMVGEKLEQAINTRQTRFEDIYPDALIAVAFGEHIKTYLIEVDMGTEVVSGKAYSSFDKKIPRYGDYLKNRFATDPFFTGWEKPQVLVIAPTWTRANNLKEATFAAGGLRSYAFTAFEFLEPEDYTALDEVWLIPTIEGAAKLSLPISAAATLSA